MRHIERRKQRKQAKQRKQRKRLSARLGALVLSGLALGCAEEEEVSVYRVLSLETRDIVLVARAAGEIEPVTTVEVKSKASGEIIAVTVETGDRVQRGDLLVRVDQRVPRNALIQAEADLEVAHAQLANADSQFGRSEALHAGAIVTDEEFEDARLDYANAKASLVRAERNLEDARIAFEDTEVRAPASGIILNKTVEVGTVIQSASQNVSGGSLLMRMADLDTVQVRTLVDETDIGKVEPGMPATITVDAYPQRIFEGVILKIEPEAVIQQNVTMFPVLTRIENREGLLRTGMSAEVEVHIARRDGVLAVPNTALRTPSDMGSAAAVLGLEMETVRQQLAGAASVAGQAESQAADQEGRETIEFRGRNVVLPEGLTRDQVQPVLDKLQGGGFQNLAEADRAIMTQLRSSLGGGGGFGGGRGGQAGREGAGFNAGRGAGSFGGAGRGGADGPGRPAGPRRRTTSSADLGSSYVVFVLRDGLPTAVNVQTGLTDLDYAEVLSGLTAEDSVLVLPSASLLQSQQSFQERVRRNTGLPGLSGR